MRTVLLALFLGCAVARAQDRASADDLQQQARDLYQAGDLDGAGERADAAIVADPSERTSTARRLQIEIALREGNPGVVRRLVGVYNTLPRLAAPERAWSQRLEQRLAFEAADADADLPNMVLTLDEIVKNEAALWTTEKTWLAWARTRLAVRQAERAGDLGAATEALQRAEPTFAAPEQAWAADARFRISVAGRAQQCDWDSALHLLATPRSNATPALQRWMMVERAQVGIRQATTRGDANQAAALLANLRRSATLDPELDAWTLGYGTWLRRERMLGKGDAKGASELDGDVADWRAQFPGEPACGLRLGPDPAVAEGKGGRAKKPAPETPPQEKAAPEKTSSSVDFARLTVGLALGYGRESEDEVVDGVMRAHWNDSNAKGGISVAGNAHLPSGLGLAGEAALFMQASGYPMVDAWVGPAWVAKRWYAGLGVGSRTWTTDSSITVEKKQGHGTVDVSMPQGLPPFWSDPPRNVRFAPMGSVELGLSPLRNDHLTVAVGGGWLPGESYPMTAVHGHALWALHADGEGLRLGIEGHWAWYSAATEFDATSAHNKFDLQLTDTESLIAVTAGWQFGFARSGARAP